MTALSTPGESRPRVDWVIRKGAFYYRENCRGYTDEPADAGRFTEVKARWEASIEPHNIKAMHESEMLSSPLQDARIALAAAEARLLTVRVDTLEEAAKVAHQRGDFWIEQSNTCVPGGHQWRYQRGMGAGAFDVEEAIRALKLAGPSSCAAKDGEVDHG